EIVVQHLTALSPPAPAGILELAHQLLLLRIDADHRKSQRPIPVPQPRQVAKLSVPILVMRARFALAARPQRELHLTQQPRNGRTRHLDAPTLEGLAEGAERAVGPLHPGGRVSRRGIHQQSLQGPDDPGLVASTRLRPAPGRRTRPWLVDSCWY